MALKILILDDDHDVADDLADILELHGHTVTTVYDGQSAVNAFEREDFDIAFFDVKMPGMNGVESFIEIKKIKPHVKVFMMTGYSVEQLLEQALAHGALGVLQKPFDVDDLIARLDGIRQGLVVIAEADRNFADNIAPELSEHGYRVAVAKSVEDATKAIENGDNLLILDLDLPILPGLEAYLDLKEKGIDLPTIMVSSQAEGCEEDLSRLQTHSVSGYFQKPYDPEELIAAVGMIAN